MFYNSATSIWFPNFGLEFRDLGSSVDFFGFEISYYGIVIACGMAAGYLMVEWMAKRTKQKPDIYLDFALYAIVFSVIGARLYFVAFEWEDYKDNLIQVFNLRGGGLAIYGGVIAAVITAFVYSKWKKINFGLLVDTGCIGLITGQIIGRFGNFFNREAFGKYTDGPFAMLLNIKDVSSDYTMPAESLLQKYEGKTNALDNIIEIRNHVIEIGSELYISVHPTFLYEAMWNVFLLVFLFIYTKHKKFNGQIFLLYLLGYGIARFFIEGLRTDQLFLWNTPFAVSQLLSLLLAVGSCIILMKSLRKMNKNKFRT